MKAMRAVAGEEEEPQAARRAASIRKTTVRFMLLSPLPAGGLRRSGPECLESGDPTGTESNAGRGSIPPEGKPCKVEGGRQEKEEGSIPLGIGLKVGRREGQNE